MNPALEALGWGRRADVDFVPGAGRQIARVAVEHRGAYVVLGPDGELEAAVDPQLREAAEDDFDFPAVGDWVVHTSEAHHDRRVLIQEVLDRTSTIVRRSPGHEPVPQLVATNVDLLCVVTTPTEDLNDRRLERYLVTALGSGAQPLIVINKVDLATEPIDRDRLGVLSAGIDVVEVSAVSGAGIDELAARCADGSTLAFIGSSGVGKSSIVNRLLGDEVLETGAVRSDGRGRHTTVRRELVLLTDGGAVIDTPGLREVQLWDDGGLDAAFPAITDLAVDCRFSDCGHDTEPGCAVQAGVASGDVEPQRLAAYRDLWLELAELGEAREEHERLVRRRRDSRSRAARSGWRDDVSDR